LSRILREHVLDNKRRRSS